MITYVELTTAQLTIIQELADDRVAAFKNWTATAVECGNLDKAKTLVSQMRDVEDVRRVMARALR